MRARHFINDEFVTQVVCFTFRGSVWDSLVPDLVAIPDFESVILTVCNGCLAQ